MFKVKQRSQHGWSEVREKIREVVGPVHVGPSWAIIAALAVCLRKPSEDSEWRSETDLT